MLPGNEECRTLNSTLPRIRALEGVDSALRGKRKTEMNGDDEFARALSDFLALHTPQSSGHLYGLIKSFLRGAPAPRLDAAPKTKIVARLQAEVSAHNSVPNFFQSYLLTHL